MNPNDTYRDGLETGFLLRIRSWRDALPVLSLVDALRPTSSVIAWTMIALTVLVHWIIDYWFVDDLLGSPISSLSMVNDSPWLLADQWTATNMMVVQQMIGPLLVVVSRSPEELAFIPILIRQLLLVVTWALPAGIVMRQSALALSGRLPMSTRESVAFVGRRYLACMNVVVLPLLIFTAAVVTFWLIGKLELAFPSGHLLLLALKVIALPFMLVAGVMTAAAFFAIPLAWAAIVIEEDGSSFSAISRGYEYVLRRPLHLVCLILLAAATLHVVFLVTDFAGHFALWSATFGLGRPADAANEPVLNSLIDNFAKVVALTAFWCIVSWCYLLLRRSANNQELEDVWEPVRALTEPLPKLDV